MLVEAGHCRSVDREGPVIDLATYVTFALLLILAVGVLTATAG